MDLFNGRAAMLGFVIGVITEAILGQGLLHQVGLGTLLSLGSARTYANTAHHIPNHRSASDQRGQHRYQPTCKRVNLNRFKPSYAEDLQLTIEGHGSHRVLIDLR